MSRALLAVVVAATLTAGCGSGVASPAGSRPPATSSPSPSGPTSPTSAPPGPDLAAVHVRLAQIASLQQPLAMAIRPGDRALYIVQKTGSIMAIRNGRLDPTSVLDVTNEISGGGEQGLLGAAFSPDGRFLYVNYTDLQGNTNVVEYQMAGGVADPQTARRVLFVKQPFANHNGGDLVFGPDGYLYIGLGDGGAGGDPFGNGQSLRTLLGKMLRIDPRPSGGKPYTIPPDNPFLGRAGARPEIWAYGLRNPWRYSFDRLTGDLWIGDVGQNAWEEVDRQPGSSSGGQNYGWNRLEGSHPYAGTVPKNAVGPVYEYGHDTGGCVVTGGYVYRGTRIPALEGAYVLADFCLGAVTALTLRNGTVSAVRALGLKAESLASFGEDQGGELYVLSLSGPVYKVVPAA